MDLDRSSLAPQMIDPFGRAVDGRASDLSAARRAEHRRAAFQAADYLMDQLKTRAPLWKKEAGPDGARWIEARAQDHADAARWTPDPAKTGETT